MKIIKLKTIKMKRNKLLLSVIAAATFITGGIIYAADHIDAPSVTNQTTDITDLYVFRSPVNTNNLVFVANIQGLMSPAATASAKFDENNIIEFNIDNTGDMVEDLVIQCKYDAATNKMYVFGPVAPSATGITSKLQGNPTAEVTVTPYSSATPGIATGSTGIQVFAGPRDDPFYFDLTQFNKIISGMATSFNNPGIDAAAGTNVMSVVLEVPKSLVGNIAATNTINVWLKTKKKN
jgi:hypothetical protein